MSPQFPWPEPGLTPQEQYERQVAEAMQMGRDPSTVPVPPGVMAWQTGQLQQQAQLDALQPPPPAGEPFAAQGGENPYAPQAPTQQVYNPAPDEVVPFAAAQRGENPYKPQAPTEALYRPPIAHDEPPPEMPNENAAPPADAPAPARGPDAPAPDALAPKPPERPEDRPGYQKALRSGNVHIVNQGIPAYPAMGNLEAIQGPGQWGAPQPTIGGGKVRPFLPPGAIPPKQPDRPPGFDLSPWESAGEFDPTPAQLQLRDFARKGLTVPKDLWEQALADKTAQLEGFPRSWRLTAAETELARQDAERSVARNVPNRAQRVQELTSYFIREATQFRMRAIEAEVRRRQALERDAKITERIFLRDALKDANQFIKDADRQAAEANRQIQAAEKEQAELAERTAREQQRIEKEERSFEEKLAKDRLNWRNRYLQEAVRRFNAGEEGFEDAKKRDEWVNDQVEAAEAALRATRPPAREFQEALNSVPRNDAGAPDFSRASRAQMQLIYDALGKGKAVQLGVTQKQAREIRSAIEAVVQRAAGVQPAAPQPPRQEKKQPWYRRWFGLGS